MSVTAALAGVGFILGFCLAGFLADLRDINRWERWALRRISAGLPHVSYAEWRKQ